MDAAIQAICSESFPERNFFVIVTGGPGLRGHFSTKWTWTSHFFGTFWDFMEDLKICYSSLGFGGLNFFFQ